MRKEKKWMFSVIEEFIQNQDFLKKYPNYRGGRIEIWHKDSPYDVEEIRFLLPEEIFIPLREAIDMKECNLFQLGRVNSEELEADLIKRKIIKKYGRKQTNKNHNRKER